MPRELAVDGNERHEKAGAKVAVHQQENPGREQHAKRQQAEDRSHKPGPNGQWHAHHGHALGAHIERCGDEVQRAHQCTDAENSNTDDPQVRAQALARARRLQGAQRRVAGPTMQWRSPGHEKGREHHDKAQKGGPEGEHVQHRESHIRRADLNGQEVIAESTLWRRGEHEENHDGSVHGHQSEISLGLDVSQKRQNCGGRNQMDAHQQREEHADKHRGQREEVILKADDFVVQTEDPLSNEPLGARVGV